MTINQLLLAANNFHDSHIKTISQPLAFALWTLADHYHSTYFKNKFITIKICDCFVLIKHKKVKLM